MQLQYKKTIVELNCYKILRFNIGDKLTNIANYGHMYMILRIEKVTVFLGLKLRITWAVSFYHDWLNSGTL